MKKRNWWPILAVLIAVVGSGGALLLWVSKERPDLAATILKALPSFPTPPASGTGETAASSSSPAQTPTPWFESETQAPIKHPVAVPPAAGPLPALDDSDPAVRDALAELLGVAALGEVLEVHNGIRRIVVTIDNLPVEGGKVALKNRPVKSVPGPFVADGDEEHPVIGEQNYPRYAGLVQLAERVDAATLVASYVRLYPLFQKAYAEFGYPNQYFNDRLIEVIDHLLEAPDITAPIALIQPKVMYQFSDPDLEALSPGHKIMIRIGPDNAARLKAKLREIRQLLLGSAAAGTAESSEPAGQ